MKVRKLAIGMLVGAIGLAGCSDAGVSPLVPGNEAGLAKSGAAKDYVVVGTLSSSFAADVAAIGGTVTTLHEDIGVAVVSSSAANFQSSAARLAGVETVAPDLVVEWIDPSERSVEMTAGEAKALLVGANAVTSLHSNEPYAPLQWALGAVQAPEAWNTGITGRGVRVAIIDGGIYDAHPDLAANIDRSVSKSFYPGTAWNSDVGTFWHGTHVAGIVAAGDNSYGVIGIAPNATLIGVKALHNGTGPFSAIINAIYYAATPVAEGGAGADVINMSLGAQLDGKDKEIKKDVVELMKAVDAATKYAHKRGVTIISSAGNDGFNFDVEKTAVKTPAQNAHVVAISSTAPLGWALGNTDFARQSSYTDYGKSLVSLSAPGGDAAYPGEELCQVLIVNYCWVFDMYLSTSRAGFTWSAGTSMAAPVASGVAALVIEKYGHIPPSEVEARMKGGALDLGKPGFDEVYGHGWVNAYNSVAN